MTRATEPELPTGSGVRLAAKLPKNSANGLREIADVLVHEPRQIRYAVIAYDVARVIDDLDASTDTAVVRIQRVEPIDGDQATQARLLLENAAEIRLGDGQLDFEGDEDEDEQ